LLKKYHIITETNKFNKEKNRAILYKTVSEFCLIIKDVIDGSLFILSKLVNKITNTPISGINIK
jgi:hypothetical protein